MVQVEDNDGQARRYQWSWWEAAHLGAEGESGARRICWCWEWNEWERNAMESITVGCCYDRSCFAHHVKINADGYFILFWMLCVCVCLQGFTLECHFYPWVPNLNHTRLESCSVNCRIFDNIPGLYTLNARRQCVHRVPSSKGTTKMSWQPKMSSDTVEFFLAKRPPVENHCSKQKSHWGCDLVLPLMGWLWASHSTS